MTLFHTQASDNATNLVLDDGLAKKLWEASETIVGLQPEEQHYWYILALQNSKEILEYRQLDVLS